MDAAFIELAVLLFVVAVAAGFVDAIAGGGGLLCVPALLAAGLSPAQALATNKLQSSFGSLSASIRFARSGQIDRRKIWPLFLASFIASAIGASLVQMVDASVLNDVLPFLLIAIAAYFVLSPRMSDEDAKQRMRPGLYGATIVPGIGFYDGIFGPGTGSFFAASQIGLLGYNLRRATANTKVLNFASNVGALAIFAFGGQVLWKIGLIMAVGQFIGGRLGAGVVMARGARVVKPLLVTVCLATTAKIVWSNQAATIEEGVRRLAALMN